MSEPLHIISLGAGVQSSTMALMAAAGEITPMPHCAIFADTQAEPASVYKWLDWLEKQLPFPVHRVTRGSIIEDALTVRQRKDGKGAWVPSGVPHYSINADGSNGHGPRQCTGDFKLEPIIAKQRQIVAYQLPAWRKSHRSALAEITAHQKAMREWRRREKELNKIDTGLFGSSSLAPLPLPLTPWDALKECESDALVVAMIGISTDEAHRMKPALRPWIRNEYPLVKRSISRDACLRWMRAHNFPTPPRSACVFCPYHSDAEWMRLRDDEPEEFQRAVEFERAYQAAKIQTVSKKGFVPYLHDSRVNLDQVKFDESHDAERELFTGECEGMCGV